jgi:hypothetical protein
MPQVGHKYGASKGVAALYVRKIEENKSGLFTAAGKYKEVGYWFDFIYF